MSRYRQQTPRSKALDTRAARAFALGSSCTTWVGSGSLLRFALTHRPLPMQGAGAMKHVEIRDMCRESIAVGDSRLRKIPRDRNVADMLTHVVASSAFVRAGVAHGLRLEVGLRPGSWEDRWPRGGVGSQSHVQHDPHLPMLTTTVPRMPHRRAFAAFAVRLRNLHQRLQYMQMYAYTYRYTHTHMYNQFDWAASMAWAG